MLIELKVIEQFSR